MSSIDLDSDRVLKRLLLIQEFAPWGRHMDGLGRISDAGAVESLCVRWLTSDYRRIELIEDFGFQWMVHARHTKTESRSTMRGETMLHALLLAVDHQHCSMAAQKAVASSGLEWTRGRCGC